MLLIAVLEVRWSRALDVGTAALASVAAALLGILSLWFPKLSDSVFSSFKWLKVVRVGSQKAAFTCHMQLAEELSEGGGAWLNTLAAGRTRPWCPENLSSSGHWGPSLPQPHGLLCRHPVCSEQTLLQPPEHVDQGGIAATWFPLCPPQP